MARGQVSPVDAALIAAAAQRGVTVSPYQLERWRTAGYLDRNPCHGLGQGKGSVAEPATGAVDRIVLLARMPPRSRRKLPLGQPLVAFADGLPVPETRVRRALLGVLDRVAGALGVSTAPPTVGGELADDQWQASWDAAEALFRHEGRKLVPPLALPAWAALAADVDADVHERPLTRQAALTLAQLMAHPQEVDPHELVDAIADKARLTAAQREQLHAAEVQAQLAGSMTVADSMHPMGISNLRRLAETIPLEQIREVFRLFAGAGPITG